MNEAIVHDPVLIALSEARESSQEKVNPKHVERANKKIQKRANKLITAWKRWYETNPDRTRFKRRKQKVNKLIDEISKLKKEMGTFVPNWMVQVHEIFLKLYEAKQI